jgi:hypothetical protein
MCHKRRLEYSLSDCFILRFRSHATDSRRAACVRGAQMRHKGATLSFLVATGTRSLGPIHAARNKANAKYVATLAMR